MCGASKSLAAEFRIAIVLVHHTRKADAEDPFDCLSGSTGLTGTADTTLVLARDSQGTTLYAAEAATSKRLRRRWPENGEGRA